MKNIKFLSEFAMESRINHEDRPAIEVRNQSVSYDQMINFGLNMAEVVHNLDEKKLVGVLGYRSLNVYQSILGILLGGKGYVPLHPHFPVERTLKMIELSGIETLVVCKESIDYLKEILSQVKSKLNVVYVDGESIDSPKINQSVDLSKSKVTPSSFKPVHPKSSSEVAYLLFTSGSTGTPKGVGVTHKNVVDYVKYTIKSFDFCADDRTSQTFDLTFDLSVHDMFVTWGAGACLCALATEDTYFPANFIKNKKLTVWFSVPTMAMIMDKMKMLSPGAFEALRLSLFCGEALPQRTVQQWQGAAPNSVIENIYGPTEATIAITRYRWEGADSERQCRHGLVPIGSPYEGQQAGLVDLNSNEFVTGEGRGELWLAGSQVTPGYWNDESKTQAAFVSHEQTWNTIWYRTGDLVERDQEGCLYFIGRTDSQVKINGYRVELSEVEKAIREASGLDLVVAIPWPESASGAEGIIAFIEGSVEESAVVEHCERLLPKYMVPTNIFSKEKLPTNSNGKVDRRALKEALDNEQ